MSKHLRSILGRAYREQKQLARKIVEKSAKHDAILAESVCQITPSEIVARLQRIKPTDPILEGCIPNVERGLVLSDSRGRGAFQDRPKPTRKMRYITIRKADGIHWR